jgi:hypothetical protein
MDELQSFPDMGAVSMALSFLGWAVPVIVAVVTLGEGCRNCHHAFQHDYRDGVKPWHVDPSK